MIVTWSQIWAVRQVVENTIWTVQVQSLWESQCEVIPVVQENNIEALFEGYQFCINFQICWALHSTCLMLLWYMDSRSVSKCTVAKHHHVSVQWCMSEFFSYLLVHSLFLDLNLHELYPCLVPSHISVEIYFPLFVVVIEIQSCGYFLDFVNVGCFCITLHKNQFNCNSSIKSCLWNLWKFL